MANVGDDTGWTFGGTVIGPGLKQKFAIVKSMFESTEGLPGPEMVNRFGNP